MDWVVYIGVIVYSPADVLDKEKVGMSRLEEFEIGQIVFYAPTQEHGTVTSINEYYVFVRYGKDTHSKATKPSDIKGCKKELR